MSTRSQVVAIGGALLIAASSVSGVLASSHREAPLISGDPAADNTDLYAFVSPDDPSKLTIIANYIPLQQPGVFRCWLLRVARPRVRAEVVVVATGAQKQCTRECPRGPVEAQSVVKEPFARREVAHVQVHVPDRCARWHTAPLFAAGRAHERIDVERIHRRDELSVAVPPRIARPVGVDLDAESVGIGQVHRLAIQVVGHPRVAAGLEDVLQETPERGAVRKQQREVIQAESPAARQGSCAGALVQFHERSRLVVRAEHDDALVAREHAEPEHHLVKQERPRQVRDLEPDAAQSRGGGQAVSRRLHTVIRLRRSRQPRGRGRAVVTHQEASGTARITRTR